jgi:predicted CXXCH cytochrome family protein
MKGRKLLDGRPMPVTQYAGWRQSVHAQALLTKGDLSAPTCNDCHGNHGATPPGLESIAAVCGQCHGREAELFRASPKHAGFETHKELLAGAGAQGCAACHDAPPGILHAGAERLSECVSCHGNHAVMRPTVALLAPLPATPCAFCHEGSEPLAEGVTEPASTRANYERTRDGLLEAARRDKVEGDELFDRLVDAALALPTHTRTAADGSRVEQRPEFARLFSKFRIGKTHYSVDDPATGKAVRFDVVRCTQCHPDTGDSAGYKTAGELLDGMRELTGLTARAERILLAARRGGVETRQALPDLDHAVDAQIELEVLVHGFSSAKDSAFEKKHREGIGHAQSALASGQLALSELGNRRKGLAVSTIVILLVLVGLALKIRDLDRGGSGG